MPNYSMTRVANPAAFISSAFDDRQRFDRRQRSNRGAGLAQAMQSSDGWLNEIQLCAAQKAIFDGLQFEIEKALGPNAVGGALVVFYKRRNPTTGHLGYTSGALVGVGFGLQSACHEYWCGKRRPIRNNVPPNVLATEFYWVEKMAPKSVNLPPVSKGIFTETVDLRHYG